MRKSSFLAIGLAVALAISDARAETPQERYIRQLSEQGFTEFSVTRTWLGRVRIRAASKTHHRELVFKPNSGEILRDYSERETGGLENGSSSLFAPASGGTTDGEPAAGIGASGEGGGSGGGGLSEGKAFDYLTGGRGEDLKFD